MRQSYWDLPPAKTDWRAWLKRVIVGVAFVGLAIRFWPIVRDFNADERAVEQFMAEAPFVDTAAPETLLTVATTSSVAPITTSDAGVADADELCASLVPGQYGFFQSLPTTVGEIRTVEGGPAPGHRLWPDALAGHADGVAAAWCQGRDAGNCYVFYVATFDGTMELLGTARLLSPPNPGPLIVE